MNTPRKFNPHTAAAGVLSPAAAAAMQAAAGALSPAAAQLDALARAGGKRIATHPDELQAQADAELPGPVGPDHWTRDDIDAALGCLEYIAASLEAVMDAAVKAGTIPASAAPPKG
jgi:hypothetical protein